MGERHFSGWKDFASSILKEAEARRGEFEGCSEATIYIGGGTPSLMPCDLLKDMLGGVRNILLAASPGAYVSETTIEVNPDDVTREKAMIWKDAGVNRVSMGVQSLVDSELKFIGRRHDSATARSSYEILRECFDNISLDLMFGLPGQTLESLSWTLDGFLDMAPEHISAYSLMYEERTALTRLRDSGNLEETDEDISVRMFEMINDRLRDAGYARYEISNYSLPGFESKHNSLYWSGLPYIGLGPSAHSYDGKRARRWNVADIKGYLESDKIREDYYDEEVLTLTERMEERILTGLRTAKGIDLKAYRIEFGDEATEDLIRKGRRMEASGLVRTDAEMICLTDNGIMISDEIIVEFFS